MKRKPESTEGARQLREYLSAAGLSIPDFCEAHGLDRIQVQRHLKGERGKRVTVDFAESIERATGGAIRWDSWRSETLKPVAARRAA
jgi:hypothetical protein